MDRKEDQSETDTVNFRKVYSKRKMTAKFEGKENWND